MIIRSVLGAYVLIVATAFIGACTEDSGSATEPSGEQQELIAADAGVCTPGCFLVGEAGRDAGDARADGGGSCVCPSDGGGARDGGDSSRDASDAHRAYLPQISR